MSMTPTTTAVKAADRWLAAVARLYPQAPTRSNLYTSLAHTAFALYQAEWGCHKHNIRDWQWPFTELDERGAFSGSEPWTVLLREVVTLARS